MKAITVRDLRPRWPEAERRLRTETELLITRDGTPVAKLVRIVPERKRRKDLLDIERLLETYPVLGTHIPPEILDRLK
jgi:antitoxin (DNA-binding transcriptional repressor) of toxin-antitoxin stability system